MDNVALAPFGLVFEGVMEENRGKDLFLEQKVGFQGPGKQGLIHMMVELGGQAVFSGAREQLTVHLHGPKGLMVASAGEPIPQGHEAGLGFIGGDGGHGFLQWNEGL